MGTSEWIKCYSFEYSWSEPKEKEEKEQSIGFPFLNKTIRKYIW